MTPHPDVTVCIPAYNGARWIGDTIRGALEQTCPPLEVLVVDDASTDETREVVRAVADPRVRLEVNRENRGLVGNWNRCLELARGPLVKFLFQDDILYPRCLEQMTALFAGSERVGLVFCRRDVLLEDPDDPAARAWKAEYGLLHTRFQRLERLNRGRDLVDQWARAGFRENWVGEPTCVMARRECFERLGGFNPRMHQGPDFEMWIRLLYFYDAGFLDEPLCGFRFHAGSTTSANHRLNRPWLDMLWLLEGLLRYPEVRASHPELRRLRYLEAARVVKRQWERLRRGHPLAPGYQARSLAEYLAFRMRAVAGRPPDLHPAIRKMTDER